VLITIAIKIQNYLQLSSFHVILALLNWPKPVCCTLLGVAKLRRTRLSSYYCFAPVLAVKARAFLARRHSGRLLISTSMFAIVSEKLFSSSRSKGTLFTNLGIAPHLGLTNVKFDHETIKFGHLLKTNNAPFELQKCEFKVKLAF
jgi:hypothetical protein